MKKRWAVFDIENGVHVVPLRDSKLHHFSLDCPCMPGVDDQYARLIVVHRAFDFREVLEEARAGTLLDDLLR